VFLAPLAEPSRVERFRFSREWLRGEATRVTDPRAANVSRRLNLPPSYVLIHRVSTAGMGVLCQLGSEGPYRAEMLRWMPGYADASPHAEEPTAGAVTPAPVSPAPVSLAAGVLNGAGAAPGELNGATAATAGFDGASPPPGELDGATATPGEFNGPSPALDEPNGVTAAAGEPDADGLPPGEPDAVSPAL
jgi:hypothetical protein